MERADGDGWSLACCPVSTPYALPVYTRAPPRSRLQPPSHPPPPQPQGMTKPPQPLAADVALDYLKNMKLLLLRQPQPLPRTLPWLMRLTPGRIQCPCAMVISPPPTTMRGCPPPPPRPPSLTHMVRLARLWQNMLCIAVTR